MPGKQSDSRGSSERQAADHVRELQNVQTVKWFGPCPAAVSSTSTIQINAQQFLNGAMFCWNAAYYRDYEDAKAAQVVGDEYEETRLYRPLNGIKITNVTQHTRGNLKLGAEFMTKAHETFVYYVSMSFNEALKKEFDAKARGEICEPRKFIQRWQRASPPEALVTSRAVGDYQKYVLSNGPLLRRA